MQIRPSFESYKECTKWITLQRHVYTKYSSLDTEEVLKRCNLIQVEVHSVILGFA